ncbi:SDR family NAD(P)-dependent oxidoreductase [Novispirillum sp. DQ9]|uniref:SDR family NAD(P)-dependent oxidoreductase n=1 Tax=Novispirillum sp. DQ9 TaxID=3398612 RepID=UPI003C7D5B34
MTAGARKIAIIGSACRFPGGADGMASFWDIISQGRDVVTEIPDDRFDKRMFQHPDIAVAGRAYTFAAGTLGDVSGFDAGFFGISAREAEQMDPQQRLLLEMAWEAMERGGQVPEHIAGTPTAVYIGVSATDYADIRQGDPEVGNAYFMLGSTLSITANRISYIFDLNGPSMAIDTACSSSIVALHEAVHALREGRAGMAVVGGIHLLLSPYPFGGFSKATMLAPYGRCRTFDKLAKGYVRGEGGGVLLLKPLDDAERDGDPILGVIREVDINTDGRTKGIALPSGEAQEALLARAYASAGVDPDDVVYVEAHGTGTFVGDPAETGAIGRALGRHRSGGPLPVGSVKSNIGHLEPAAGMAGLIKALLVLRHRVIPPTINVETLNPDIDFAGLNLAPALTALPLPETERPAIVGVNSFGFGGTNAHVILEEYRASRSDVPAPAPADAPLYLSARTEPALRQLAGAVAEALRAPGGPSRADAAWTLALRRSHMETRLVARGADAVAALADYAQGEAPSAIAAGTVLSRNAPVGLVFSGNGSQWSGMGAVLLGEDPVFRAAIERIDVLVSRAAGWSVLSEMALDADPARMDDTRIAQPVLFALQVGLVESLRARGLTFAAVTGHSVGEVAAAWACGALSLEQAVTVILERSAAQGRTRGHGRMAAADLDAERAAAVVARFAGRIEVAAYNSPKAVTLSGEEAALADLGRELAAQGTSFRMLDLDYAFHNRVLEPVRDDLAKALKGLRPQAGEEGVAFHSTVTGGVVAGTGLDAAYWWANVRQPVRFRDAIAGMAQAGVQVFLEIGPHPIMQAYVRQTLRELDVPGQPLSTMMRQKPGAPSLVAAIDRVHTLGGRLDFAALFPGRRPVADLPTYPWQRERHWFKPTPEARGRCYQNYEGPLLGYRPVRDVPLWETMIDAALYPYLGDHKVGGAVVFPAAGFLEMALEAATLVFDDARADVEYLEIRRPLVLEAGRPKVVRLTWNPEDGIFRIESRQHMQDEAWSLHVTGRLADPVHAVPADALALPAAGTTVPAEDHYALARAIGLDYGPAFQAVRGVTVDGTAAVAELAVPEGLSLDDYRLHPSLFDGCLQALFDVMVANAPAGQAPTAYLPYQIGRFLLHDKGGVATRCRVNLIKVGPRSLVADFVLTDDAGTILAEARRFRFLRAELLRKGGAHGLLHAVETTPLARLVAAAPVALPLEDAAAAVAGAAEGACGPAVEDLTRVAAAFAAEALAGLEESEVAEGRAELLDLCRTLAARGEGAADAVWRAALGRRPDHLAELTMIGRAGRALPKALRDAAVRQPVAAPTLEHFFDAAPTIAAGDAALAAAVGRALAARPATARLRVLEVGAGTGGLSRRLLAVLPADGVSLVVTDRDEDALARLDGEIGSHPGVAVERLDILDPELGTTGPVSGRFDIVVASGLLSAVDRPLAVMEALAGLAAPGGLVMLAEPAPAAWLDLAFGLNPLWWRRHDNDIALPPLMDPETLADFAAVAGLDEVAPVEVGGAIVMTARSGQMVARAAAPAEAAGPWLVAAGTSGAEAALGDALMARLEAAGAKPVRVTSGDDWAGVVAAHKPAAVVHLLGLGAEDGDAAAVVAHQTARCWSITALAQAMQAPNAHKARLVVVTAGAQAGAVGEGAVWGLGRVLQNEAADLKPALIDLQDAAPVDLADALAAELLATCPETEVILAPDRRLGLRVRPSGLEAAARPVPADARRTLAFTPGSLDNLRWVDEPRRAPAAGEVEIAVRAAGLNFRDVMFALGVLPDEAVENGFAGATTGMEAGGVVTRVGPGVSDLAVGDEVLCFAPACFSSHITTAVTAVARKPSIMGFAEAATVPTVFFTVYYALHHLARLEAGERILIHGGAGGVGLAAIQYARHLGAEVYTTVGTAEKRDLVILAGVPEDHIFDSRSTAFADQILAATGGQGVDVVLNSLAGEAIHKSLMVLRPFGRFLELGKRDFFANSRMGLRPFRNNITYYGIDADQLMVEKPVLAGRLFREMTGLFETGVFTPLPYRVFDAPRVVEAFRHMQQSRHVGKIVLTPPAAPVPVEAAAPKALSLDPAGAYLVTGGLGGFGLRTAEWLAAKGARHLVLASRRGVVGEEAAPVVARLKAAGVKVEAKACDVADEAAVRALVAATPTLKGVVHAAAVYDDGVLGAMAEARFATVLGPKAGGAWALHRATEGLSLDLFVVYSSVTTLLGNPGQANYVAANQALEALIERRRRAGLPGLAVCWGGIADAGYLARNAEIQESLQSKLGAAALTAAGALDWLERLLVAGVSNMTVAELDWRLLRGGLPALRTPRFAELRTGGGAEAGAEAVDIQTLIEGLSPAEIRDLLVEMLSEELAHVLRIPADRINPRQSIFDMGMDSLMALELKMVIEERFGVDLPPMAISEGGTVVRLAEKIRDHLIGEAPAEGTGGDDVAHLAQLHAAGEVDLDEARDIMADLESGEGAKQSKLIS